MKILKEVINIILFIIINILTIYFFIISNLFYSFWFLFSEYKNDILFFILIYGFLALYLYLLYIFYKSIKNNIINKIYIYIYILNISLFLIFIFFYYTSYDKKTYIEESFFYTKYQYINIKEEENIYKSISKNIYLLESINYTGEITYCLKEFNKIDCEKSLDTFLSNEFIIYRLNNEFIYNEKLKFYKTEIGTNSIGNSLFKNYINLGLIGVINNLNKGNIDLAINNLISYKNLIDLSLKGDFNIIDLILFHEISNNLNNLTIYIIDNYTLSENNLSKLKNIYIEEYDYENIILNSMKIEYNENMNMLNTVKFRNSLVFNKYDLFNENRKSWIDAFNLYPIYNNPFKVTFIYNFFNGAKHLDSFFKYVKEDYKELNNQIYLINQKIENYE